MRIVAGLDEQGETIFFEPGRDEDPNVDINHEPPNSYEIEPLPEPFKHEKPYKGAKYLVLTPVDFEDARQVPVDTEHPHKRFVGRAVRKEFHMQGDVSKPKQLYLGKVIAYSIKRQIFAIAYEDGDEAVEADESIKILNAKMVYKRKYVFDTVDQREYFLKWKGRLAVVGTNADDFGDEMVVAHYVDDLIVSTTNEELRVRFIAHLNKMWKITYEGTLDRFIGVNFRRDEDGWGWKATMSSYIDRLAERFDLKECRPVDVPMDPGFILTEEDFDQEPTPEMISHFRSIIGSIGYAAIAARFDISHAVSVLSRHLARPCKKVIDAGLRVIRYLVTHRDVAIHWRSSQQDIESGNACSLLGYGSQPCRHINQADG